MQTKLLSLLFFITYLGYSQAPISSYNTGIMSNYSTVSSMTTIDQSASGANLTWNFNTLSEIGTSVDTYAAPTASELMTYPETTSVLTVTSMPSGDISETYTKDELGSYSFTGLSSNGLILNYNADNALIGTFPLTYLDSNTDNVSGTFSFGATSGTFSGTIISEVDAYGTLIMNDANPGPLTTAFNGSVTRLKTVQNIDLLVGGFINAGTAVQTVHNYYDDNTGNLLFRTIMADVTSAFISIPTTTVMESLLTTTLGTSNNEFANNELRIFPNPVKNYLNFKLNNDAVIRSIRISDLSGRQVLKVIGNDRSLQVNQLRSGIYIVSVTTEEKAVISMKFTIE